MKASALNPLYEMMFGSSNGCVSEFNCFAWLSNFIFQRNWNPGFCMLAFEIFGSVLTHDVRCASPLLVVQLVPPRPCACARPAAASDRTRTTNGSRRFLMTETPTVRLKPDPTDVAQ